MKAYFVDNNSNNLIVVLCGWALDEKPFECITSGKEDILFLYDYSSLDLTFPIGFSFEKYSKKTLIAFSYGVFMAQFVLHLLPTFDEKIAVNGTLKPIDKEFGINPKIFDLTLSNVSEQSMLKFYEKMFDNNLDFEYFSENLPYRNSENCKNELEKIKELALNCDSSDFKYDKAIIANADKIIPTKSQERFWAQNCQNIRKIDGGHFVFYKFKNFGEIISL